MNRIHLKNRARRFVQIVALLVLFLPHVFGGHSQPAHAQSRGVQSQIQTEQLRDLLTVDGIMQHLQELQTIADAHDSNRAAGTAGHRASVEYLVAALEAAEYQVTRQPFTFDGYLEVSAPVLSASGTSNLTFGEAEYAALQYSGNGQVSASVQAVDILEPTGTAPNTSTSGCEQNDFAAFQQGGIALIQRGTCPFAQKVGNAVHAGASAILIFNEGQPGRTDLFTGTLGEVVAADVPVLATSHTIGRKLLTQIERGETVQLQVKTDALVGPIDTVNVVAETTDGDSENVVMVGGHFDSVEHGPGINDNGSGTATLLEVALQMAKLEIRPVNKVRFAFWSAEELGLLGSTHYIEDLQENRPEDLDDIALYLNFDMIGSPNYIRGVYQLNRNAPTGTDQITEVLTNYFDQQALYWEPITIGGRSDHAAFMRAGVAVGGLFSGAENVLSQKQAQEYGHERGGIATDPCYHQSCDTIENINTEALNELGDAAAHALWTFAVDKRLASRWGERPVTFFPGSHYRSGRPF